MWKFSKKPSCRSNTGYSLLASSLCCCCCCRLPYATHLPASIFFSLPLFYLFPPSLRSFSAVLRASTHIKWRAAVRFQFRTHLWCCRPPTRSAVAEGTQGSPITALYANVLAPGQQRGHAGTRSLFMQISGRQSQHNTEPATDTGGHISPPAQKKGNSAENMKDVDWVARGGLEWQSQGD